MYDQVSHLEVDSTAGTWAVAPGPHFGGRDIVTELRYTPEAGLNSLDNFYKLFSLSVGLRSSARILTVAAEPSSGHS